MTKRASVASITKIIGDFSDQLTLGMDKNVRKHFREYLLGMMIPPEIRRKSISNISSLVSLYNQSTINICAYFNTDFPLFTVLTLSLTPMYLMQVY